MRTFQLSQPFNSRTYLKASSLFYAIVISLLLAMITGFLIVYSFHNKLILANYQEEERVQANARSGLNLLLSKQTIVAPGEEQTIDLYNTGRDSVRLKRKSWGVLEIASSSAFSKKRRFKQAALTGAGRQSKQENMALYIADHDKLLSLCGSTFINGECYLPQGQVKRAYIEGQSFMGDNLVNGTIKKSDRAVPGPGKEMVEKLSKMFSEDSYMNDSIVYMDQQEIKDTIENSFENKTLLLYSAQSLVLSNKYLKGNIVIFSKKTIQVEASVHAEDILLCASGIVIKENVSSDLQAFGRDSVVVQKNVRLNYPSFLGLTKSPDDLTGGKITVDENTSVSGGIIAYMQSTANINRLVTVSLHKNTTVTGTVYSSSIVDLKGRVYGNVICDRLMLKTPSSVYENHLLDATIDITKMPEYFAGAGFVISNEEKKIVKWVD